MLIYNCNKHPYVIQYLQKYNIQTTNNITNSNIILFPRSYHINNYYPKYTIFPEYDKYRYILYDNKINQYIILSNHNIPVPDYKIINKKFISSYIIEYPIIIKRSSGGGGEFVELINNFNELNNFVNKYDDIFFIIQTYINKNNRDVRIILYRGEIHYCFYRENNYNFKTNLRYKESINYDCTDTEYYEFAHNLYKKIKPRLCALDIIKDITTNKLYLLEINMCFGLPDKSYTYFLHLELEYFRNIFLKKY